MTPLKVDFIIIQEYSLILLMDTSQGFINHQAKAFLDRTIPHYHPYIELVDGECHQVREVVLTVEGLICIVKMKSKTFILRKGKVFAEMKK